jgi:hypothetical protein
MSATPPEADDEDVRTLRVTAAVLVTLLAFGVLFAVSALSFGGARFGWVPAVAAFAATGVAGGWIAGNRTAAIAFVAAGCIAGGVAAHIAPPTHGRLGAEIDTVVEDDWRLVDEHESGSAVCFDYCRQVEREYVATVEPRPLRDDRGDVSLLVEAAENGDGTWRVRVHAEAR